MNLGELQSVQSKERQSSSLQHLRASFYQEAGEFVQELRDRRDRVAAKSEDPFGSDEVRRLTDDMETAQRTVESLYERRVGKVVKMASIAAADMPYDEDGLTHEEAQLFEGLVAQIKQNRSTVLSVLDGGMAGLTCSRTDDESANDTSGTSRSPDPNLQAEDTRSPALNLTGESSDADELQATGNGVTAADGEAASSTQLDIGGAMGSEVPPREDTAAQSVDNDSDTVPPSSVETSSSVESTQSETASTPVNRQVIRITGEVGDIFGVDGRTYDLSADDVVDLPEENASILVGQDNAEPLD
jgi:DNA replication factor GINS